MMKKMIIGICILLVVICLIPKRVHLEDGGTVVYKAILYQVKDVHTMGAEDPAGGEYLDGKVVKILGIEVYNDVKPAEIILTPTESALPEEEVQGGCIPPAEHFSTVQEAVEHIKEVKAAGVEQTVPQSDQVLYQKDHIYALPQSPLPGYQQAYVALITEGIHITYTTDMEDGDGESYGNKADFWWFKDRESDETVEELTKRFGLYRYKDTKFFFGQLHDDRVIYWWENGDQFSFEYPAETFVNHVDIIEYLVVEKYDVN